MRSTKLIIIVAIILALCGSAHAGYNPKSAQIENDASRFTKNLTVADTTVQHALETIDQLTVGGGGVPYTGATADLNLGVHSIYTTGEIETEDLTVNSIATFNAILQITSGVLWCNSVVGLSGDMYVSTSSAADTLYIKGADGSLAWLQNGGSVIVRGGNAGPFGGNGGNVTLSGGTAAAGTAGKVIITSDLSTTNDIAAGTYHVGAVAGVDSTHTVKDGNGTNYHHYTFTKGILTAYVKDTNP